MNTRTIALVTAALVIAGLTAMFARNWMAAQQAALDSRPQAPAEAAAPIAATDVLVASRDVAIGSFIRAEHLKWQAWPDEAVAGDYITRGEGSAEDFEGAVARRSVFAGEPVTDRLVVHPGDRGFLAAVLEPGKRAVSVPVDATTGISGFIFPGDRVDIILTFRTAVKDDESGTAQTRQYSETLLRDVRVLAIDQRVENEDGAAKVAKTATLEVSPKQAEKVALGLQLGTLSLSLRSLAQGVTSLASGAPGSDDAELPPRSFTSDTEIFFMEKGSTGRPREPHAIQILRGSEAEVATF